MKSPKCQVCPHSKCFVKYCTPESIAELEKSKSSTFYKKGQFIFQEGNPVHGIYLIYSGKVKVLNTGYNGKTQCIRLAKEGHILGHRGLNGTVYSISASTIEDSIICFIEKDIFNRALKTNIELTYHLMLFYAEELRIAEERMRNLAQMTVREKVAEALLLVKKNYGTQKDDHKIILDAPLTRKDIADIAGIRPEQVIRTLADFKKERLINIERKKISIIDLRALSDITLPYYRVEKFYDQDVF